MILTRKDNKVLTRSYLEALYHQNNTMEGKIDPILFPKRFSKYNDIEAAAFISAVFAYGNIKQINAALTKLFLLIGENPVNFLQSFPERLHSIEKNIPGHRFYSPEDTAALLHSMSKIYTTHGSLEILFKQCLKESENNFKNSIHLFHNTLRAEAANFIGEYSHGLRFMFPDPDKGSACKRLNLFLRWMVRKDNIDFGIWKVISPADILIPVDTHISAVARRYKLTERKNISWAMAEEITNALRKFDSKDPVRYDFALCHNEILSTAKRRKSL